MPALPLALFRITYSLALAGEVMQAIIYREFLFGDGGFRPGPLLLIHLCSLAALLLGWKVRYAAIVNYICTVMFLGFGVRDGGTPYHADGLYIAGALFLLFAPTSEALALQHEGRPVGPIYGTFLTAVLSLLYLDAVLWKSGSPMWWRGLGTWAPMSLPNTSHLDWSAMTDNRPLMLGGGYGTFALQWSFPFLVWTRLRKPLLVAAIGLHVMIGVFFPLPLFGLIMVAFLLGCWPTADGGAKAPLLPRLAVAFWVASEIVLLAQGPLTRAPPVFQRLPALRRHRLSLDRNRAPRRLPPGALPALRAPVCTGVGRAPPAILAGRRAPRAVGVGADLLGRCVGAGAAGPGRVAPALRTLLAPGHGERRRDRHPGAPRRAAAGRVASRCTGGEPGGGLGRGGEIGPLIVIFDGECNLCNRWVDFAIERDPGRRLRFAASGSEAGRAMVERSGLDPASSIYLAEGAKLWDRSTAALRIARVLRFPWCLAYGFILVPRPLRDVAYRLVARNRYRWFGRRATCRMPTEADGGRFL